MMISSPPSRAHFSSCFMRSSRSPWTRRKRSFRSSNPKPSSPQNIFQRQPLTFRQWDGYEPKPDREFPNQWHVEAGTPEKRRELGMLTVIVPHRAGQHAEWTAARLESDTAIGARVMLSGKPTIVAFRKAGSTGPASLPGVVFDGSAMVQ